MRRFGSILVSLVLLAAVPVSAGAGQPALTLNGKLFMTAAGMRAPHIHADRMYVHAESLARALGARYRFDTATGIVTIDTGHSVPTVEQLQALNPKMAKYMALGPYVRGMGIHLGAPGPHVTLAIAREGTVNAIPAAFPADAGWAPWFDQPEGQALDLPGLGRAYTQHIYLTDPRGLKEDMGSVRAVVDGRILSFPWEPAVHLHDQAAYVPVRPVVDLLGGSIGP